MHRAAPETGRDGKRRGRGEILTIPDTNTAQGLSLWCFNIVGGEILTIPDTDADTPTTQGLSLWCFNIVGGEILTIPDTPTSTTQGLFLLQFPMVIGVSTLCERRARGAPRPRESRCTFGQAQENTRGSRDPVTGGLSTRTCVLRFIRVGRHSRVATWWHAVQEAAVFKVHRWSFRRSRIDSLDGLFVDHAVRGP